MFNLTTTDVFLNRLIVSSGILLFTFLLTYFIKRSLDVVFSRFKHAGLKTVKSLLKNIIDIAIFVVAIITVLSLWGINTGPLLTGAGIIGLAFSFGAQTLVKDLIAGFFIITENQFKIGDRVKIGSYEGEVYRMTLRLTILRDDQGNLIYIANSQITAVTKLT